MDFDNLLRLEFLSRAENVGLARVAIAAFAARLDYTVSELDDLKGAISEAVSNAILHGYGNNPDQVVKVAAYITRGELEVVVEDRGCGIADIDEALKPGLSTADERLGLGFSFMRSFVDRLEIISEPGKGTRVRMFKRPRARSGHARPD